MAAEITLVLGGARSGKSEVAERRAAALGTPVTYVATAGWLEGDEEWAARIEAHRTRRPAHWSTVEVAPGGDLPSALGAIGTPVLVDSLGAWVAGLADFDLDDRAGAELRQALIERRASERPTIVVTDEVGLGVHPATESGRLFRDALGALNRRIAADADVVLLVVAGRSLVLGEDPG